MRYFVMAWSSQSDRCLLLAYIVKGSSKHAVFHACECFTVNRKNRAGMMLSSVIYDVLAVGCASEVRQGTVVEYGLETPGPGKQRDMWRE